MSYSVRRSAADRLAFKAKKKKKKKKNRLPPIVYSDLPRQKKRKRK